MDRVSRQLIVGQNKSFVMVAVASLCFGAERPLGPEPAVAAVDLQEFLLRANLAEGQG